MVRRRRRPAAIIDPVLDFDSKSGAHRHALGRPACIAFVRAQRAAASMDPRDPCPRRPPVRGAATCSAQLGGAHRHRRAASATVQAIFSEGLQPRAQFRQTAASSTTCSPTARRFAIGALEADGAARAGPHAGRHGLPHRRRGVRRRHAVHARRRHGARRLSRRRRAHAVPLDPPPARAAAARRGSSCATTTRRTAREPHWETTVAEQRARNIHVRDGVERGRVRRDAHRARPTLEMPTLILPSIQVNIRAGELPPPEANGVLLPEDPAQCPMKRFSLPVRRA